MVHKAGQVAIGFAKTETALGAATVVAVLHAADAAPDGVRKLKSALQRRDGCRENRRDRRLYLGAIGFGIGAVKCDTCSPACRP